MFIEHRTYTLKPGSTAHYMAAYEKADGLRLHEAMAPCVGWYATEAGDLFRLVTMWKFDSLEERQRGREKLYEQEAWRTLMDEVQPLVTDIRSQLIVPAGFWSRSPRGKALLDK